MLQRGGVSSHWCIDWTLNAAPDEPRCPMRKSCRESVMATRLPAGSYEVVQNNGQVRLRDVASNRQHVVPPAEAAVLRRKYPTLRKGATIEVLKALQL